MNLLTAGIERRGWLGTNRSPLCAGLPMRAQLSVEFLPAFLGEEDSGIRQVHALACRRKRVGEPPRPFRVEVNIVHSPNRWLFSSTPCTNSATGPRPARGS